MLYGEKVIVSSLNQLNVESYLSTYKKASAFSKAYEMMPDYWENRRKCIENYVVGETENKARYLIIEKISTESCGYIELDYNNPEMPEVDIAILEEYQRKGYAFDEARVLLKNVLEKGTVKYVIWSAFSSNKASCKIAEKLGGVVVEEKKFDNGGYVCSGFEYGFIGRKGNSENGNI